MEDDSTKFAVVRADAPVKNFSKWHDTLTAAKTEAVRLARAHGAPFYVVQTVGYALPPAPPVEWVECRGERKSTDF